MPLLVPDFTPWDIVTKNSGPGARAPESVRIITVAAKLIRSINTGKWGANNNVLCALFGRFVYLC